MTNGNGPDITLARLHAVEQQLARTHATNVAYQSRIIELESWLQASQVTPATADGPLPCPSPYPPAQVLSPPEAWSSWVILIFLAVLGFAAGYSGYTLLA